MKIILISLISLATFACPNLQGRFTCSHPKFGDYTYEVEQRNKDGLTHYRIPAIIGGENLIADNQWYEIKLANYDHAEVRTTCSKNGVLIHHFIGKITGAKTVEMISTFELNELDEFISNLTINYDDGTYIGPEEVCPRT